MSALNCRGLFNLQVAALKSTYKDALNDTVGLEKLLTAGNQAKCVYTAGVGADRSLNARLGTTVEGWDAKTVRTYAASVRSAAAFVAADERGNTIGNTVFVNTLQPNVFGKTSVTLIHEVLHLLFGDHSINTAFPYSPLLRNLRSHRPSPNGSTPFRTFVARVT